MEEARLNLAVRSLSGASLVEADGEVGPWTTEAFHEALKAVVDGDSEVVILDLTRVRSLDVGALKVLRETCIALGDGRRLCAVATGGPRTTLEIARFDDFLGVYPSLEDALGASPEPAAVA